MLRKACKADIPKFCQPILAKATSDSELEGQVISCLKLKYADQVRPPGRSSRSLILICRLFTESLGGYLVVFQRLSPDCEDQIRVILQESALDYRLDPQLQIQCTHEVCITSGLGVKCQGGQQRELHLWLLLICGIKGLLLPDHEMISSSKCLHSERLDSFPMMHLVSADHNTC